MTEPTKQSVHPAKTQISPVWSESSLSAWRNIGSSATHWAHCKDSDRTGWIPRLIWAFAGHTVILLVLSCCGSYTGISVKQNKVNWARHPLILKWTCPKKAIYNWWNWPTCLLVQNQGKMPVFYWQVQCFRASINVQNEKVQDFENETWSRDVTQNLVFFCFKTF